MSIDALERIQIEAVNRSISVTIRTDNSIVTFGGSSSHPPPRSEELAPFSGHVETLDLPEEHVLSFEFEHPDTVLDLRRRLVRFDAHVHNIRIRLSDNGYTLNGTLVSWVAYTGAHAQTKKA